MVDARYKNDLEDKDLILEDNSNRDMDNESDEDDDDDDDEVVETPKRTKRYKSIEDEQNCMIWFNIPCNKFITDL